MTVPRTPDTATTSATSATPATAAFSVSSSDVDALREQLGRVPRGVVGIAARCVCGRPAVVRTAPRLPDGSPFPTTYYLTHPAAVKGCSTLEAEHLMEEFNARLAADEALADAYAAAHEDYLARRAELGRPAEIEGVSAGGMPTRVKSSSRPGGARAGGRSRGQPDRGSHTRRPHRARFVGSCSVLVLRSR